MQDILVPSSSTDYIERPLDKTEPRLVRRSEIISALSYALVLYVFEMF